MQPNTNTARSKRLTIAIMVAALALVAITLLILVPSGPAGDSAGGPEAPSTAQQADSAGASPVEETHRLRPNAFCTKRRCGQQNPCCNSCGHRSWIVAGTQLEARAKQGKLPRCSVNGCGGCAWALEATGYREEGAFIVVRWRKVGRPGQPPQGPAQALLEPPPGPALVWLDITEPSQRRRPPWGQDRNIKRYFASHGVTVLRAKLTPRTTCRALRCPPGRTVKIQIRRADRQRVWRALGGPSLKSR